jgi:hypothetical protein
MKKTYWMAVKQWQNAGKLKKLTRAQHFWPF